MTREQLAGALDSYRRAVATVAFLLVMASSPAYRRAREAACDRCGAEFAVTGRLCRLCRVGAHP